ncbi:MAG: hypothetical protein PUD02_04465 [Eggerthellales bacterium]|nr:hypothetical protein [Eggerthellales bacterium]
MGAVDFLVFKKAETAREAYRIARDEAVRFAGENSYNGTISTTDFRGVAGRVAEEWGPEVEESARRAVRDDFGYGEKWECLALDCGRDADGRTVWALFGQAAC